MRKMHPQMEALLNRLKAEGSADHKRHLLKQWHISVHLFYGEIASWLQPLVEARVATCKGHVETEGKRPIEGRGRISCPDFFIQVKRVKFVFHPSSIGHIDLQVLGRGNPKLFQVVHTSAGKWMFGDTAASAKDPFTEESLAQFLNKWV